MAARSRSKSRSRGSARVRAGSSERDIPAGSTVAHVKAILAPVGRDLVLIRGSRVLRDGEKLKANLVYVAQPVLEGAC